MLINKDVKKIRLKEYLNRIGESEKKKKKMTLECAATETGSTVAGKKLVFYGDGHFNKVN